MNPQSSNTPGLGLPDPGSAAELPAIHAPEAFHAPEIGGPHFDINNTPAAPPPPQPAAIHTNPVVQPQPPQQVTAQPSVLQQSVAEQSAAMNQADDTDNAFDEAWADKTREIVSRTYSDPYVQAKEIGKLKAQYIKARYNRDIKVSDD